MNPKETRFVKVLVDSGLISFKEAGQLEHLHERYQADTGEHKAIWDIAVDAGVVTSAQITRVQMRSGGKRFGGCRLVSKLGQGGMGAVYKAVQESMDRTVAIKVLPRNLVA